MGPSLKGTWDQRNSFCLKWSFFIIKQNCINKKFPKFACRPQLACLVFSIKLAKKCKENQWKMFCISQVLTLNSKFCNFTTFWNVTKTPQNFVQDSFSIRLTKICYKNRGEILGSGPFKSHLLNKIRFIVKETSVILKKDWWYLFLNTINVILTLIMDSNHNLSRKFGIRS